MPDFLATGMSRHGGDGPLSSHFNTITEEDGSRSEYSHLDSRASESSQLGGSRSTQSRLGSNSPHGRFSNHSSHLSNNSNHSHRSDASPVSNKNNFFRQGLGNNRRDDYRDAPPPSRNHTNNATSEHGRRSLTFDPPNDVHDYRSLSSKCQRYFRNMTLCCRPSNYTIHLMTRLISSRLWHVSSFCFTMILLFGGQVQELWIPKDADVIFDVLFTVAFVFFSAEIILRLYAEPRYFSLDLRGKGLYNVPTAWCRCRIGSFMFWCDLVSTFTLLYNISFINKRRFAVYTVTIALDENGYPVS